MYRNRHTHLAHKNILHLTHKNILHLAHKNILHLTQKYFYPIGAETRTFVMSVSFVYVDNLLHGILDINPDSHRSLLGFHKLKILNSHKLKILNSQSFKNCENIVVK